MKFDWDEAKRKANLHKHGVDFADCPKVFAGPCLMDEDEGDYDEVRFLTIGLLDDVVVVISHTETDDTIRIIFARKAERYERENYFRKVWQ